MRPVDAVCAMLIATATLSVAGQTRWQFPVTIEALQDVPAHADDAGTQHRGVLYVGRGQAFTVRKGFRFQMLKINKEGGCRIEFEKKQYDVSSCPWLDGFRDHQNDVFWVVPGPSSWTCPAQPIEPCLRRHGRLSSQNGISLKIWLVGTRQMVALENNIEDLPEVFQKYLDMTSADHSYIFGDFDICPVDADTPGRLTRVCVADATKIVVQPLDGSRPSFRLVSTWPKTAGR